MDLKDLGVAATLVLITAPTSFLPRRRGGG
jgi:hypothetical protein